MSENQNGPVARSEPLMKGALIRFDELPAVFGRACLPLPSLQKSVAERDLGNRFSHDRSELAGWISNRYEPEGHNISGESKRLLHLILQQHVISRQYRTQSQSAAGKQDILHCRVDAGGLRPWEFSFDSRSRFVG